MNLYRVIRPLVILTSSILLSNLIMYSGYLIYVPEFGSEIDSYYRIAIRVQFILVGLICSIFVFLTGKKLNQNFITSVVIFIVSGLFFAWFRPEAGQYHWRNSLYEFYILYFLAGFIVGTITVVLKNIKLQNKNRGESVK